MNLQVGVLDYEIGGDQREVERPQVTEERVLRSREGGIGRRTKPSIPKGTNGTGIKEC